jgi:hypothetical protein
MDQKTRVSAEEIIKALNEALRRRKPCAGMHALRIFASDSGPANWDADISGPDGGAIDPECKRAMLSTKLGLQNRYELATD